MAHVTGTWHSVNVGHHHQSLVVSSEFLLCQDQAHQAGEMGSDARLRAGSQGAGCQAWDPPGPGMASRWVLTLSGLVPCG